MPEKDNQSTVNDSNATPNQPQGGLVFIILGWIFFVAAIFFMPSVFGAGTIFMGVLVRKRGRLQHGFIMIVMGVVGAVIGFTLGAMGGGAK